MTTVAGYNNVVATEYGPAGFWVLTDLVYTKGVGVKMTLAGYIDQASAATMSPIGYYHFDMSPEDAGTMFGSAQTLIDGAVAGSGAGWASAVFVPAT